MAKEMELGLKRLKDTKYRACYQEKNGGGMVLKFEKSESFDVAEADYYVMLSVTKHPSVENKK